MAIETRSATKRRAYQAAKELDMDNAEWALTKLQNTVEWPFRLVKRNLRIALLLLAFALILTVTYFTTNLIEQLWGLALGQVTDFSVSRK